MSGNWKNILDPIVAKFNAAWLSNGVASWNAKGSKAMALLLADMGKHLDNGDDYFIPKKQAEKDLKESNDKIVRTMSDHGRMLWRDDVEGHCDNPDLCFDYSETVRCGPCAIKQANAAGVATLNQDTTYNPQEARLRRENLAKDEEITRLTNILQTICENIKSKIKEVDDNNSYWGGPQIQQHQKAPEILKNIESLIEDSRKKEGQNHHEHSTHSDDQSSATSP